MITFIVILSVVFYFLCSIPTYYLIKSDWMSRHGGKRENWDRNPLGSIYTPERTTAIADSLGSGLTGLIYWLFYLFVWPLVYSFLALIAKQFVRLGNFLYR